MSTLKQCPVDVLELVIALLPVADLCRLKTVCKEWNEIITTRAFQENGELKFNKLELLAICDVDGGPGFKAYDAEAENWHSFDLSFLPVDADDGFRVLDFAGGLACVVKMDDMKRIFPSLSMCNPLTRRDMERALYICNPLTKRWTQLPSPSTSSYHFKSFSYAPVIVRTYYCRKMGHYKVFLVSRVSGNRDNIKQLSQLVVEEFDSSSREWVVHSQTCDPFGWEEVTGVGLLPCDSGNGASLFILVEGQVFALLFDEGKGGSAFVKIEAPLPSNLLNPTMVCSERNPRPLLVTALGDRDGATGIEIWELGNQFTEWTYLAAMPSDLFRYLKSLYSATLVKWWTVSCVRRTFRRGPIPMRTVVAVPYKHLIYVHDESAMSWTIAYDTLTRSWRWLSAKLPAEISATMLPQVNKRSRLSGVRGCAFEPSLAGVIPTNGSN